MNKAIYIYQQGSALLVALIFLGVLTMVGVSVTLTSTSQLQISANSEDLNDTFFATNAGMNRMLAETAVKGKIAFGSDQLLDNHAQSATEVTIDTFDAASSMATAHTKMHTNKVYGVDGDTGKQITGSIRQKAKGAICPRAKKASSVTKIACDHFVLKSKYSVANSYEPSVEVGVYREMIYSNSATNQSVEIPAAGS